MGIFVSIITLIKVVKFFPYHSFFPLCIKYFIPQHGGGMIIRLIQQKVPIGSILSVILKTGQELEGYLTEIGEFYITLNGSKGESFLTEESIAAWKIISNGSDASIEVVGQQNSIDPNNTGATNNHNLLPNTTSNTIITSISTSSNNLPQQEFSVEVIKQEIYIVEKVRAAIENLSLEPESPNFQYLHTESHNYSYRQQEDIRREFDRCRNRYEYALKVKELSRLNQIIYDLELLLKRFPDLGQGWFIKGCLCLMLNKTNDAIRAFELASIYEGDPNYIYNLAVAYNLQNDTAKVMNALINLFGCTSPSKYKMAFYRFISLISYYYSIDPYLRILKEPVINKIDTDIELLLEGVIYILSNCKWVNEARTVVSIYTSKKIDADDLLVITTIFNRLKESSSELLFQRQQKELSNAEQQFSKTQEEVRKQKELLGILAEAESLARQGNYELAVKMLDKILETAPSNSEIIRKRQQYEVYLKPVHVKPSSEKTAFSKAVPTKVSSEKAGLPEPEKKSETRTHNRNFSPYAEAKSAYNMEGNLEKAESLYRRAIAEKDNIEQSVRDLAHVLQQKRNYAEAIQVMNDNWNLLGDKIKALNILATLYQHNGQLQEAIDAFYKLLPLIPEENHEKVFKQIGFCYYKLKEFDQAEKVLIQVLNLNPQDQTAKSWLSGMQQAKQTGTYQQLDQQLEEIFSKQDLMTESTTSISQFLRFFLDRCEYKGVSDAKIPTRNFSEEDLNKLRGLIEGAGRSRPGLRAQHNLSAAKLLIDLETEDEKKVRQYLQSFSTDMGNSSIAEQKPREVAVAYYLEAFAIAPYLNPRLKETLPRIMTLFYEQDSEVILGEKVPSFIDTLEYAIRKNPKYVVEILLELSLTNNAARLYLLQEILKNEHIQGRVQDICCEIVGEQKDKTLSTQQFIDLWDRGIDFIHLSNQQIIKELIWLQQLSPIDSPQDHIKRMSELEEKVRGGLDPVRVKVISQILQDIYSYVQELSYVERERLVAIIKNRIRELMIDIEGKPTKFTLEMVRPYLVTIEKVIDEHFGKVQQMAEPEYLEYALSVDSYFTNQEGNIDVKISITNLIGKSPASEISIHMQNSLNNEYEVVGQNDFPVSEALPGGKTITRQIPLHVTEETIKESVFTLLFDLSYTTRIGKRVEMRGRTLPVRLYSASQFESIKNPYAEYAEGGIVEKDDMFFGRDKLIERLKQTISEAQSNKSLVVYGQKRTGKSSVVFHLKESLDLPFIPVLFSIGEVIKGFSFETFLAKIFQAIEDTFYDLADKKGLPTIEIDRPTLAELNESPQLVFHDYYSKLRKKLSKIPEYRNTRIILLIDEFSYIYTEIREGRVPDTFMKSWKAMLEKGYFGSVLVGQDIMRQFIEKYPNEFQVAQSERVTYLDPDDAFKLMTDPIRIPGTNDSRYRGGAPLERLHALTAGNPFYIQIFCNFLLKYMNENRVQFITDYEIERVKDILISGSNHLTIDKFDNLINAGDSVINAIPDKDTLSVLRGIALGSKNQNYCSRSSIECKTTLSIDEILEDLVRREVVDKHGTSHYRIRVELFKEWLLVHQ